MATKVCTKCGQTKELELFYPRQESRDGRQSWCKSCVCQGAKDRYVRSVRELKTDRPCFSCKQVKVLAEFSRTSWECRLCANLRASNYRAADPLLNTRANLKSKYGMTIEDYDRLLMQQGGGCAICGSPPKTMRLHVDHDHACCPGKRSCGFCIRGLLCYPCNGFLGKIEGDYMRKVRKYLERGESDR